MSRGDRREEIFKNDVDRQEFRKTLAEACPRTGFERDPLKLAMAARLRRGTTPCLPAGR